MKYQDEKFFSFENFKIEETKDFKVAYGISSQDRNPNSLRQKYSTEENLSQWNSSKIVFTEKKVEYWLNGSRVLFFIPWSKEWNEKKNSGKWDNAPDYGKFKKGYIGFQDHPGDLWLKNIKIKKL